MKDSGFIINVSFAIKKDWNGQVSQAYFAQLEHQQFTLMVIKWAIVQEVKQVLVTCIARTQRGWNEVRVMKVCIQCTARVFKTHIENTWVPRQLQQDRWFDVWGFDETFED